MVIEKEPLKLEDVPGAIQIWVLAAGGLAAAALLIWWLAGMIRRARDLEGGKGLSGRTWLLASLLGGTGVALLTTFLPWLWFTLGWSGPAGRQGTKFPAFFLAGVALVAVCLPVLHNLIKLRWRRIWALARLSVKEAIRSRILWAFSALLLVFLFASWFLPYKPENQVRNYVSVVFFAMTILLILTAGMLAAFSIPADLRRQTIHTIVTKPVERFEIVLGRFLGYTLLMTGVLAVMSCFSLIYVTRQIDQEAKEESFKARVPLFGDLDVWAVSDKGVLENKGINVGREWTYRTYIRGGVSQERATWAFHHISRQLGDRDLVRCEFTFDIFRTTKGEENKGVFAAFAFANSRWKPELYDPFSAERLAAAKKGEPVAAMDNRLAEQFGYYEAPSVKVEDYHTQYLDIPGALFRNLPPERSAPGDTPPLQVTVHFISPSQYLGVAKYDLYFRQDKEEQTDLGRLVDFGANFFKGALGLWFRLCLVIGVAVTCSTYLSGVISFLSSMFLYLAGMCLPFIKELATGKSVGGGPMESLYRLGQNTGPVVALDRTPAVLIAEALDKGFAFLLHPFIYCIPDVSRYGLTDYVAEGFDISGSKLLFDNFLPLAGYLAAWAVLAYYLVKSREIAS